MKRKLERGWSLLEGKMTPDMMLKFIMAWALIAIAERLDRERR
jgi:hypothetical protein